MVVSDDLSTDESCPDVSTVGDGDAFLDPGESITCTATYDVTAGDVTAGSVTNTASATVDGVTSNQDSETVFVDLPELTLAKSNDTGGSTLVGVPFNWTLTVSNIGPQPATFDDPQTIVRDPLPAGANYGLPTPGNFSGITNSGSISCSIDGSDVLTCVVSGASVVIGATSASFTVTFSVDPTAAGSLANTATVDPDGVVTEGDETNNTGSDTVTVTLPPTSTPTPTNTPVPTPTPTPVVLITDPAVTKSVSPSAAAVGDTVTFTLFVSNLGPGDADNVQLVDQIPAFLLITDVDISPGSFTPIISGNTVTINFGTVTPSDTYTITTEVRSSAAPQTETNTADITTSSPESDTDNNSDSVPITIIDPSPPLVAPETGFAPNRTTTVPLQPAAKIYQAYGEIRLEIPTLGVAVTIVGIPFDPNGWDVTWLTDQAGYLAGTAFPTWRGNSVITGHNTLANGNDGPFARLQELRYGDQIIVTAWGLRHIYEVREEELVSRTDSSIFRHEELAWITLLTCDGWDERIDIYRRRRLVRAVLISIETVEIRTTRE